MKHEAIYKLYSNAVTIEETENGTLTVFDITGDQITIDDSAVSTKATELETAAAAEEAQKEIDAANGNQKLLDLGLTQAEATALTGYKPTE
jgi:hypothetical protein